MKNLISSLNKITVSLIILLAVIPVIIPLTKPGFFPTQDFIHVARIYEMDTILKDGQFPPRWVPDFRYGEPLFDFYAPLPFYIGSIVHNLGFSFLDTTKVLFGLGFLLSTVAMFLLGRKLYGNGGGLIAGTLYLYAPYHSVDVYVRGALSEGLALIFFPLIFLAALNLSEKGSRKNIIFLSFSLAGLFFTHNIMTILFMPFFAGWVGFLLWRSQNPKKILPFLLAFVLGFGLAATFLLPAFFERDLVQSNKLISGYFDFRAHFVEIKQFFSTFWGYGASLWGPSDGMSFQVGLTHWAALGVSLVASLILSKGKKFRLLVIFLTAEFLFSLFMQHNKSTPLWLKFPLLAYTQFPWRFLGISIFLISLVGGSLAVYLLEKLKIFSILIIIVIILANFGYFHPESYYLDSVDSHYLSAKVLSQDDKLPKDYLPIWVKQIKKEKITAPEILKGEGTISQFQKRSDFASFNIAAKSDVEVEVPLTFFPGWQVFANNNKISQATPTDLGLIHFFLPPGFSRVKVLFSNTLVREIGNWLSLLTLAIVILLFSGNFLKRIFKNGK